MQSKPIGVCIDFKVLLPVMNPNLGARIGILENGKLNAASMLQETAAYFERKHGCTIGPIYSKNNAGAPAPHETLALAAEHSDFLITGLGD